MADDAYRTYKETFTEQNPFICYAPEDDQSISDAAGGGGEDSLIVTLTLLTGGEQSDATFESDKTIGEIYDALMANRNVIIRYHPIIEDVNTSGYDVFTVNSYSCNIPGLGVPNKYHIYCSRQYYDFLGKCGYLYVRNALYNDNVFNYKYY